MICRTRRILCERVWQAPDLQTHDALMLLRALSTRSSPGFDWRPTVAQIQMMKGEFAAIIESAPEGGYWARGWRAQFLARHLHAKLSRYLSAGISATA